MNYNIQKDNPDFSKTFEIFCANHKKECLDFLKNDAFYLKTDTLYSEDINQILGHERMLLNIRLKADYDRNFPQAASNKDSEYSKKVDFEMFKKSIINYLGSEDSGYNSVRQIFKYDPIQDPFNLIKDAKTGEYTIVSVGKNFNVVNKIQDSVANFLDKNKTVISNDATIKPKI